MELKFFKMHGCGNDYIFIDNLTGKYNGQNFSQFSTQVSHRNFGIGGDGVVVISKSKLANAKMNIYNSDGSEGKMCGNAVRCIAKYLIDNDIVPSTNASIETLCGIKNCVATLKNGECDSITIDMNAPNFDTQSILKKEFAQIHQQYINQKLRVDNTELVVTLVSMGNPHTVIFWDKNRETLQTYLHKHPQKPLTYQLTPNNISAQQGDIANYSLSTAKDMTQLQQLDITGIGSKIERHNIYADRTNVEFVTTLTPTHLQMRVWERGSQETLACGTGATAIVAVACKLGICPINQDITVTLQGGQLMIRQTPQTIYLSGSCEFVFGGVITIENET